MGVVPSQRVCPACVWCLVSGVGCVGWVCGGLCVSDNGSTGRRLSSVYHACMSTTRGNHPPPPPPSAAFLLAQLGAHAAQQFAHRITDLDLTPAQAGLLRTLAHTPGRSQRQLADTLG